MLKRTVAVLFVLAVVTAVGFAQDGESKTLVRDREAARKLLGKHKLSLQWISWDYFGSVAVTREKCKGPDVRDGVPRCYRLTGVQKGRGNEDYLKVKGLIETIDAKQFDIEGEIETRVSHINNGKPCVRSGHFTFKITGKRKYWRLMEMNNPCDEAADYVDIYFR